MEAKSSTSTSDLNKSGQQNTSDTTFHLTELSGESLEGRGGGTAGLIGPRLFFTEGYKLTRICLHHHILEACMCRSSAFCLKRCHTHLALMLKSREVIAVMTILPKSHGVIGHLHSESDTLMLLAR